MKCMKYIFHPNQKKIIDCKEVNKKNGLQKNRT